MPPRIPGGAAVPAATPARPFAPKPSAESLNYSFMGKARKDQLNGVKLLSAQLPGTPAGGYDQQFQQQTSRLQARFNTYLDTVFVPNAKERVQIGPISRAFTQVSIPTLKDARVLHFKSFNERKAYNELKRDLKTFDSVVVQAFYKKIEPLGTVDGAKPDPFELNGLLKLNRLQQMMKEVVDPQAQSLGRRIYKASKKGLVQTIWAPVAVPLALLHLKSTKPTNIDVLREKKQDLKLWREVYHEDFGLLGKITFPLFGRERKLRQIERRIAEIRNPSPYELERAKNRGDKVTNHSLYIKHLGAISRAKLGLSNADVQKLVEPAVAGATPARANAGAIATQVPGLESPKTAKVGPLVDDHAKAREFTRQKFDTLCSAIRDFQESGHSPQKEEALCEIARDILYSGERGALHQFIREDMPRQLKRAGIDDHEDLKEAFAELQKAIPKKASVSLKTLQSVVPGLGKQMRLVDEAIGMEEALPRLLKLLGNSKLQGTMRKNLMHSNLDGVNALKRLVDPPERQPLLPDQEKQLKAQAMSFLRSPQGNEFRKALIAAYTAQVDRSLDVDMLEPLKDLKNAGSNPSGVIKALIKLIAAPRLSASKRHENLFDEVVKKNLHLFMETSDREFWEREAIDKVATPLIDKGDGSRHRMFKQMHLRAAALGIPKDDVVEKYMKPGLAHTLQNRSMLIAGSQTMSTGGAVIGKILTTPATAPLAAANPVFATPGILELPFMASGYVAGGALGALYGALVMRRQKKRRLAEAGEQRIANDAKAAGPAGTGTPTIPATPTAPASPTSRVAPTAVLTPAVTTTPAHSASLSASSGTYTSASRFMGRSVEKPQLQKIYDSNARQFWRGHAHQIKELGKEVLGAAWIATTLPIRGLKWATEDLVLHRGLKRQSEASRDRVVGTEAGTVPTPEAIGVRRPPARAEPATPSADAAADAAQPERTPSADAAADAAQPEPAAPARSLAGKDATEVAESAAYVPGHPSVSIAREEELKSLFANSHRERMSRKAGSTPATGQTNRLDAEHRHKNALVSAWLEDSLHQAHVPQDTQVPRDTP